MKVLCVDPGYSLIEAGELFQQNNYPGHLLYGTNHFMEHGIEPVFERRCRKTPGRIWKELGVIKAFLLSKPDLVYLPFINYGSFFCMLKGIGLFRKIPVVALVHNLNIEDAGELKGKNLLYRIKADFYKFAYKITFLGVDRLIFINHFAYCKLETVFPFLLNKAEIKYLMPEVIEKDSLKNRERNNHLVSIGKTYREYEVLINAINSSNYTGTIVSGKEIENCKESSRESKIKIITHKLDFLSAKSLYRNGDMIIVPVRNTGGGGVYGLSSVLDALAMKKPVIVSKTKGMGIPVQSWGIGREYNPGDPDSLLHAIDMCAEQYDSILENIEELVRQFNIKTFSAELCAIFKNTVSE